ncbi:HBR500Wp [Eremothecium sinecaudum]|uniref:HBR500Wp n=1 Tax=Eremothecium sinecaudum TaxID=45286 RepID=A0A109UVN7_9SACH|nr:HBR500Wp [Eremothecium sinecaudum]AMD19401.1 HBR500Wp [Eremothecium sinecaudum]
MSQEKIAIKLSELEKEMEALNAILNKTLKVEGEEEPLAQLHMAEEHKHSSTAKVSNKQITEITHGHGFCGSLRHGSHGSEKSDKPRKCKSDKPQAGTEKGTKQQCTALVHQPLESSRPQSVLDDVPEEEDSTFAAAKTTDHKPMRNNVPNVDVATAPNGVTKAHRVPSQSSSSSFAATDFTLPLQLEKHDSRANTDKAGHRLRFSPETVGGHETEPDLSMLQIAKRRDIPTSLPSSQGTDRPLQRRSANPFRVVSVGGTSCTSSRKSSNLTGSAKSPCNSSGNCPGANATASEDYSLMKLQRKHDYLTMKCVKLSKEIKYLRNLKKNGSLSVEDNRKLGEAVDKLQHYLDRKAKEKYEVGVLLSRKLRKQINNGSNGQFWVGAK